MGLAPFEKMIETELTEKAKNNTLKGSEKVISGYRPAAGKNGPRYLLAGESGEFIRFNSNSYLGLSHHPDVIRAEEEASREFGCGPGAVRFISGTTTLHRQLEEELARFHNREAAIIYSSAYAAVMGTLSRLIDSETLVISDELNHNCIINAIRLARPAKLEVFPHLDYNSLENILKKSAGSYRRAVVATDGIFSMRGDHADIKSIADICQRYEGDFNEGVITFTDDSHGVGACGSTGRGAEELTNGRSDLLAATLGKALGVNGGYVVSSARLVDYLRETSPFYIYSNPITSGEAAAAIASLKILQSPAGKERLRRLGELTERLRRGLSALGLEALPGQHPIVALLLRDSAKTARYAAELFKSGFLATAINYPVVPRGQEEIRFQLGADHTNADVDYLLDAIKKLST